MTGTITDVCEAAMMLGERFGYDSDGLGDPGCVYEYWDGSGFPGIASGDKITEPAQVLQVASLAVAGHRAAGPGWAADLVRQRRGHTLAPAVAPNTALPAGPRHAAETRALTSLFGKVTN